MLEEKIISSKENIVKVAFALFLEKGYKEVTIKKIMKATQLSKGAIYHHFESKEAIYFATLETYYINLFQTTNLELPVGSFKENIEEIYDFAADLFSNIENLTAKGLEFPIRDFYSFQLESEKNEIIRNRIQTTVIDYRNIVKSIISQAADNKEIRLDLDIDALTLQIIGMIEGIAINHSTIRSNVKSILLEKYKLAFDNYFKMICIN